MRRLLKKGQRTKDFKKRQVNQTFYGRQQGHPAIQLPKYMARTKKTVQQEKPMEKSQTREELKELQIKKLK